MERSKTDREQNDLDLCDALRFSGINKDDALAVQRIYGTAGSSGSYRIVSAMQAIHTWLSRQEG